MSNDPKAEQAMALIAALQTILDRLPEQSADDDAASDSSEGQLVQPNDPTHELFVDRLNQGSLAGLFTSIRIIHNIHNTAKRNEPAAAA